jgi:hypothetical protein
LGKKKEGTYNDQRTIQNFSDHTLLQVRDIEELTSLGARYQSLGVEKGEEGVGDKEKERGREEGYELGKKKKGKCPYNDQRTIQNFSDHTLLQVRDIEELTSLGSRCLFCFLFIFG